MKRASKAFKNFRGHAPDYADEISVPSNSVYYELGKCDGILYTTKRDGKIERYIHEFSKKAAPVLAVSYDGQELRLVGGDFRVTERGIEDNS